MPDHPGKRLHIAGYCRARCGGGHAVTAVLAVRNMPGLAGAVPAAAGCRCWRYETAGVLPGR